MAYSYRIPPHPGYVSYDPYSTSASTSPSPEGIYNSYVPQYGSPGVSPDGRIPARRHVRTASYNPPKVATWTTPVTYSSPAGYYTVNSYSSPPVARYDHVSTQDSRNKKSTVRRSSVSGHGNSGNAYVSPPSGDKRRGSMRSQKQRIYVDAPAKADDRYYDNSAEEPIYVHAEPRVARQTSTKKPRKADNYFFFSQNTTTTTHDVDTPTRSRARRASTNSRSTPTKPVAPPRPATAADAHKHKVPAGYCLKNWDPTEAPILLLGSVFDANSLGKWVYDWTVYANKAHSPLAEMAGELWLLLIQFAGKKKRAEACYSRIRSKHDRHMVRDFLESGDQLWSRLKRILKSCEEFMWKAAKERSGKGKGKVMGEQSGVEFVRSIWGRDRELEPTERLMTNMRLWMHRYDVHCEDVVSMSK